MLFDVCIKLFLVCESARNVQQRAACRDNDLACLVLYLFNDVNCLCIVVSPDVLSVHNARKQHLALGETVAFNKFGSLFALDKIKTDAVKVKRSQLRVAVTHIAEICLQKHFDIALAAEDILIQRYEQLYVLCVHILYKCRLV